MLTQEKLKEELNYDPDTGEFTWKRGRQGRSGAGKRAGCLGVQGYRYICIDGKHYRENRLAWLYVYGEPVPPVLDHINRVRDDNRIANLREVSVSQNSENSNAKGCCFDKWTGKWRARIKVDGKVLCLGRFAEEADARRAYAAAKEKYHISPASG